MKVQEPELGGAAESLAGRDKGRLYLIVGTCGETLLLADGKYRKAEEPKPKNKKHVRLLPRFYPEIARRIGQGKDENSEIRAALKALAQERGNAAQTNPGGRDRCPKTT